MRHRIFFLVLVCCFLTCTAVAQPGVRPWSAWLYNPASGSAWLIDDQGVVLRDLSGLPSGGSINHFPRIGSDLIDYPDIAVSNTGRYFVYRCEDLLCVLDTTTGQEILRYDLFTGDQSPTFDTMAYSWVRRLFNPDDKLLAFGVNRSNYQTHEGGWEIIVLDLATGEAAYRLRDTDPAAQAVELPGFNFVPIIQHFDEAGVSFTLFPDGTESGPHYAGWTWNLASGDITCNRRFTTYSTDVFAPTGEVIFPAVDGRLETFPCEGECLQFVHVNTLYVFDPALGLPFPFYHSPNINFWQANFIQNGEKSSLRV